VPWGLVTGLKKKLAKKERGNIPSSVLIGGWANGTDATGIRDAVWLSKKKTKLRTNKAQLNLTQHGWTLSFKFNISSHLLLFNRLFLALSGWKK
jgi:hypothetical protein